MRHASRETSEQSAEHLQSMLGKYTTRLTDEVKQLALTGDWEVIRSLFRVLDAYTRAKELRAQGQPARAHLWLVGVGRKRQKVRTPKQTNPPQPAA